MSRKGNWTISDTGRADLSDIWNYIALDNEQAATRMIIDIFARFDALAAMPRMGRSRVDLGKELRHLPVGNYSIFYILGDPNGVHIVRFQEGHRDTDRILGDQERQRSRGFVGPSAEAGHIRNP